MEPWQLHQSDTAVLTAVHAIGGDFWGSCSGQTPSLRAQQLLTSLVVSQQTRSHLDIHNGTRRLGALEQEQRLAIPCNCPYSGTAVTGSSLCCMSCQGPLDNLTPSLPPGLLVVCLETQTFLQRLVTRPRVRDAPQCSGVYPAAMAQTGASPFPWRSSQAFSSGGHMGFGPNVLLLLETETGSVVTLFAAAARLCWKVSPHKWTSPTKRR